MVGSQTYFASVICKLQRCAMKVAISDNSHNFHRFRKKPYGRLV